MRLELVHISDDVLHVQGETGSFYSNLQSIELCSEGVKHTWPQITADSQRFWGKLRGVAVQIRPPFTQSTFYKSAAAGARANTRFIWHDPCWEAPVVAVGRVHQGAPPVMFQRHSNGLQRAAKSLHSAEALSLGAPKCLRSHPEATHAL